MQDLSRMSEKELMQGNDTNFEPLFPQIEIAEN